MKIEITCMIYVWIFISTSPVHHLLVRKCDVNEDKLPFDYCKLTKFEDTSKSRCECICRNHQCNFYNPKCQTKTTEYTFVKDGINGTAEELYHSAFGSDPKEFHEYMLEIHNITTTTSNVTLTVTSPMPIICMNSNCTIKSLANSMRGDEKLPFMYIMFCNILCIMKYTIVS